jgi:C-terminal processing protease CtpA/Prc
LPACGGGGGGGGDGAFLITGPGGSSSCDVEGQKAFVLDVAQDWYLWYDELAPVDPADFENASTYLSALTAPLAEDFRDPGFSYLTTPAEDAANLNSGTFVGFGFRYGIDLDGSYLISDAFESGNAFAAGFRRGAEILAVDAGDGYRTMREYEEEGASLDEIFGPSEAGLERGFRLGIDGDVVELVVAKSELDVPPLASAPLMIERQGLPPSGYIHLRSFTQTAIDELDQAFETLSTEGISDYVIDLRYNSGGLVDVAERFLDILGGEIADRQLAYRLAHNDKRQAENYEYRFDQRRSSVLPLRIAFITSETTASASEQLINSLAPYVELALIGSDTAGKAVGQYAFDQASCDTRLRLVSFEMENAAGLGAFYTGLADTGRYTLCTGQDVFSGAFGTPDESLTAGAMAWLNEGACPTIPASVSRARRVSRGAAPITGFDLPDRRSQWVQ